MDMYVYTYAGRNPKTYSSILDDSRSTWRLATERQYHTAERVSPYSQNWGSNRKFHLYSECTLRHHRTMLWLLASRRVFVAPHLKILWLYLLTNLFKCRYSKIVIICNYLKGQGLERLKGAIPHSTGPVHYRRTSLERKWSLLSVLVAHKHPVVHLAKFQKIWVYNSGLLRTGVQCLVCKQGRLVLAVQLGTRE